MKRDVFLLWENLVEELPELLIQGLEECYLVQLWKEERIDAISDSETGNLRFGVASVSLALIEYI